MRVLEYKNKKNCALELVIDLFFSLESIKLIQHFIHNIEVINIDDTQEEISAEVLHLNDKDLYALSKSDYLSSQEFHLIIINRFCESLNKYIEKHQVLDSNISSLILSDYRQTIFNEMKSVDLSKIFNSKTEESKLENYQRVYRHLEMENFFYEEPLTKQRQNTLKKICSSINKMEDIENEPESRIRNLTSKNDNFSNNPDFLDFLNIPRHLVNSSEARGRLYPKIKNEENYKYYIEPLLKEESPPDKPVILSRDEIQHMYDEFNNLPIFDKSMGYKDYMMLIEGYQEAGDPKGTFRKMFDIKSQAIVNSFSAKNTRDNMSIRNKKLFSHSNGLIAHCYWRIHQDENIKSLMTKLLFTKDITDYLDTLLRFFIFIETELIEGVLPDFADYSRLKYEEKLKEYNDFQSTMNDPGLSNSAWIARNNKLQDLNMELKSYTAKSEDIEDYGIDIIKIHFNYEILQYVISLYLFAISRHETIVEEYKNNN